MSTIDPRDHDTPRIYVASLSDYNAGRLHGWWIDADQDADAIAEEVAAMLAESPALALGDGVAEAWAIHDYDGFGSLRLSEWESFERVAELAAAIAEHGAGPVAAFVGNFGEWDADSFADAFMGEYASLAHYAEELAEEMGSLSGLSSEWPFTCIDWDRAGRELVYGGDIWTADADGFGFYVFRNV